jgi:hypothetical protein
VAINGRFRVSMDDVSQRGRSWSVTWRGSHRQRDEETGDSLWSVLDADGSVPKSAKTMVVKVNALAQPETVAGLPFPPVEFEGLTVTPHISGFSRDCVAWRKRKSSLILPVKGLVERRVGQRGCPFPGRHGVPACAVIAHRCSRHGVCAECVGRGIVTCTYALAAYARVRWLRICAVLVGDSMDRGDGMGVGGDL